jgi:hypothetical protein
MAASLRLHSVNVVGEAQDKFIAENLFRSLEPEAVLIDLQFSGEAAIVLLQRLRNINPALGIVITTSCPDLRLFGLTESNIPSGSKLILKRSISDLSVITGALALSLISAKDGS